MIRESLAVLLASTSLWAQTPPPGTPVGTGSPEETRICDAIKVLEDFAKWLCEGGGQSTPEPTKGLGKARAANAKKMKQAKKYRIVHTLEQFGANGWTNPETGVIKGVSSDPRSPHGSPGGRERLCATPSVLSVRIRERDRWTPTRRRHEGDCRRPRRCSATVVVALG